MRVVVSLDGQRDKVQRFEKHILVYLNATALRGVVLAWWEDEGEGRLYAAASSGDPSELREFAFLCMRGGRAAKPDRPRPRRD